MRKKNELLAVAIHFEEAGELCPSIGAIGERKIADVMEKIARRYGIPVVKKDELAAKLRKLSESEEIPRELYEEVAEALCVFRRSIDIS